MTQPLHIIIAVGEPKLDYYAHVTQTDIDNIGLNNAADNYYTSDQLERIKNALSIESVDVGGSITNTIIMLAKLKRQSHLLGYHADDQNNLVADTLKKNKTISWLFNAHKAGKGNLLVIVNKDSGERLFVNADYSGAEQLPKIILNDEQKTTINNSALIMLEGYDWLLPQKTAIHQEIMHYKGQQSAVALSLSDISVIAKRHDTIVPFIIEHVDLLFGNEAEIEALLSKTIKRDIEINTISIDDLAQQLNSALPNTTIFMSFGDKGAYCFANGAYMHKSCDRIPKTDIINTNGAGDCFMAGVLDCYLSPNDKWIERGLIKGTLLGTACIQSKTTIPIDTAIDAIAHST